jgi:hypothetical protein
MGLKFRRGTTAQKSGSLAFGEPYVNTDLGTLQIGGLSGDITLGSTGTGSTGTFGAISGSGLDVTGNANIGGNLTVGGQLTIGDNTSDTVNVVASLSSSLIPQTSNAFDLGSETKIWRDLYISTGSIKFVNPGNNTIVGTLSSNAGGDFKVAGEISGSSINGLGNATAYSASVAYRMVNLESDMFNVTASVQALNRWTGSIATTASINTLSASIATTISSASSSAYSTFAKLSGGNTFSGTQTITGSLFISQNLVVQGSSSLQNITASAVSIGTNTVILNTDSPSVRFGGIQVIDSGSSSATGSLFWDSQNDVWVYVNPTGSSYASARLLSGPKSATLGSELPLTNTNVPKIDDGDHLVDSQITDDGTTVKITNEISASTFTGLGNLTSYSTSVDSRIVTNLNSAAGAFASASAYSASAAIVAITNANSAAGAFASASAYSASAAVIDNTQTANITTAQNSANGAFASASAFSASAATTYARVGTENTFTANQIINATLTLSSSAAVELTVIGNTVMTGSLNVTGDVVAFSTSDKRHKNNIVLISDALSKVTKLNGVTWEWNEDVDDTTKQTPKTGLIAQEVQEVLPEVVKERQDGFLALDYSKMMGLMVEAIKEQQTQIHSLTLEIQNLKKNNSL